MWNLFLDDEREPANNNDVLWTVCRSSEEAINMTREYGLPTICSLDHDLGGEDTGMRYLKWVAHAALNSGLQLKDLHEYAKEWYVHSQNPVGKANMLSIICSWNRK